MTTSTEPRPRRTDHPVSARRRNPTRWLAPAALVAFAMVLLFVRLGEPARIIFDETYYVQDAKSFLLTGGVEDSFAVHPPMGKWLIAGSIQFLGDTALGWRASGAVAGGAIALLTWLLGLRLFGRRWQAGLATFLLAIDGLFIVQARTAMLDIHLALFVVLGAWLLLRDLQDLDARDRTAAGLAARPATSRWLAGIAFGLAAATKWSGLLALGSAIVLTVGFELVARRRLHGTPWRQPGRLAWLVVAPLLLVPAATYLATYIPWLVSYEHTTEGIDDCEQAISDGQECTYGITQRLRGLAREHVDIANFHRDLESTHAYRSQPHTWPVLGRPISYYYETCPADASGDDLRACAVPAGTSAEVLALGNPALWWGWALLVPLLTGALGRRDPAAWLILGFHGGLFIPWLVVARPAFFFYMTPALPFLALGMAAILGRLRTTPKDWLPWAAGAGIGLSAAVVARVFGGDAEHTAIAFGVGWVLAPFVATAADEWHRNREAEPSLDPPARLWQPTDSPPDVSRVPVMLIGGLVVAAAVACFAWFFPLWYGIPIDAEALRARWWFDSWI